MKKFNYKDYKYLGYVYAGVPQGWKPIVEKMIIDIDKLVRPRYLPKFVLNAVRYLATGNSVVRLRSYFWHGVHRYLSSVKGHFAFIYDIKEKYAGLRVYGGFTKDVETIVEAAIEEADKTCQQCGSRVKVTIVDTGWQYNLCLDCKKAVKNKIQKLKNTSNEKV